MGDFYGTEFEGAGNMMKTIRDRIGNNCEVCLSSYLEDGETKLRFVVFAKVGSKTVVSHYAQRIHPDQLSSPEKQESVINSIISNARLGINQSNLLIFWGNAGDYHEQFVTPKPKGQLI